MQPLPLTNEDLAMMPDGEFANTKWTHLFVFRTELWQGIIRLMESREQSLRQPHYIMHTVCDDLVLVWFKFKQMDNDSSGRKIMPTHTMANADFIVEFADGIHGPVKYLKDRFMPYRELETQPKELRERFRQELLAITRLR